MLEHFVEAANRKYAASTLQAKLCFFLNSTAKVQNKLIRNYLQIKNEIIAAFSDLKEIN